MILRSVVCALLRLFDCIVMCGVHSPLLWVLARLLMLLSWLWLMWLLFVVVVVVVVGGVVVGGISPP